MTSDWHDGSDTTWSVAAWAVDMDRLGDRRALLHYFEKPWHYDDLYEDWRTWMALEAAHIVDDNSTYGVLGDEQIVVRDAGGDLAVGDGQWEQLDCRYCGLKATVYGPEMGPLCFDHLEDYLEHLGADA